MNKIKINIYSSFINSIKVEINLDENKITFNQMEKVYSSDKIFSIFNSIVNTTKDWQKLYTNPCITDGINFQVEIRLNNNVTIYKGQNSTPNNFYKIHDIIKFLKGDILCY